METAINPNPNCIDNIGVEVLIEILTRLPIRLAHRCKSVSKHWLDTISSEYFGKTYNIYHSHLKQLSSRFALAYYSEDYFKFNLAISDFPLEFVFDFVAFVPPPELPLENFRVLSSNNGLVLCSASTSGESVKKLYFVCNPTNKTWVSIPQPPSCTNSAHVVGFLCQAPYFSKNKYYCGNSKIHADTRYSFRIVRFSNNPPIVKAEIYSSETREWTEYMLTDHSSSNFSNLLNKVFEKDYGMDGPSINCGGLIYLKINNCKELIVIDPYRGLFGSIRFPNATEEVETQNNHYYFRPRLPYCFSECNGHLRCIKWDPHEWDHYEWDHHDHKLSIWELEDTDDIYAGNWFWLQEVDLAQFKCSNGSTDETLLHGSQWGNSFPTIVFHPYNENIIFHCDSCGIKLCNIMEKTFRKVCRSMQSRTMGRVDMKVFPTVLPWWPLSDSRDNSKTVNKSLEALMGDLNLDYSSIPVEDDFQNRSSKFEEASEKKGEKKVSYKDILLGTPRNQ